MCIVLKREYKSHKHNNYIRMVGYRSFFFVSQIFCNVFCINLKKKSFYIENPVVHFLKGICASCNL